MPKLRVFGISALVVALGFVTLGALTLFRGPTPAPITPAVFEDATTRWVTIPVDNHFVPLGPILRAGDPIPWVNNDAESQPVAGDDTTAATDHAGIEQFNKNGTSWLQLSGANNFTNACPTRARLVKFDQTIPLGPKGIVRNTLGNFSTSVSAW